MELCAGTSEETATQLVASRQQSEVRGAAIDDLSRCMICLDHVYGDLSFRTAVGNTVRHINDTPPLPPAHGYSKLDQWGHYSNSVWHQNKVPDSHSGEYFNQFVSNLFHLPAIF